MTTADLQRRCAELAGWTEIDGEMGLPPGVQWTSTADRNGKLERLPDYPHDMNAARELMALIPDDYDTELSYFGSSKQTEFADRLWRITGGALFDLLMATPEQICRAFVKVMS